MSASVSAKKSKWKVKIICCWCPPKVYPLKPSRYKYMCSKSIEKVGERNLQTPRRPTGPNGVRQTNTVAPETWKSKASVVWSPNKWYCGSATDGLWSGKIWRIRPSGRWCRTFSWNSANEHLRETSGWADFLESIIKPTRLFRFVSDK